jgi:hypothetical protein
VEVHDDWLGRTRHRRSRKDVELLKRIRPVSDIADGCHIGVRLLLAGEQWRIELGGTGPVDNRADLPDAFGNVRRHLRAPRWKWPSA